MSLSLLWRCFRLKTNSAFTLYNASSRTLGRIDMPVGWSEWPRLCWRNIPEARRSKKYFVGIGIDDTTLGLVDGTARLIQQCKQHSEASRNMIGPTKVYTGRCEKSASYIKEEQLSFLQEQCFLCACILRKHISNNEQKQQKQRKV